MALRDDLKQMLIKVANLDHLTMNEIQDDSSLFGDDIGLDSIDLLELVVHLDKKYNLKVENDEQGRQILQSINTIADAIEKATVA